MKKIFYLILILSILLCCAPKQVKVEKIIEDGVEVVLNHIEPYKVKGESGTLHLEREFSIDTENFTEENIAFVTDVETDSEGNVYILDRDLKKIVKFDSQGNFIQTIGREGQGPAEFQGPRNLRINVHEEIVVYDRRNKKFSFFQKDGALIKEIKLTLDAIEGIILDNGNYLLREMLVDQNTNKFENILSLYSSEFKKIKEFGRIGMPDRFAEKIEAAYRNLAYSVRRDNIFVANPERGYEIQIFDLDGNLLKKIGKEYKRISPSEEYKEEFLEPLRRDPRVYNFVKDRLYFPDSLPPFHYILTNEEGRLFVQTYEKGENPKEYMFDIFNSEGVFVTRKSLRNFSIPDKLIGNFKNKRFCYVYEKESGFKELVVYKVIWKK